MHASVVAAVSAAMVWGSQPDIAVTADSASLTAQVTEVLETYQPFGREHGPPDEWRGTTASAEGDRAPRRAFETRVFSSDEWDRLALAEAHSLGRVTARVDDGLAGLVNVVWKTGSCPHRARKSIAGLAGPDTRVSAQESSVQTAAGSPSGRLSR